MTVVQPCVGSGCYPYPQPCFGPGCYPCYPYECTPYSYFTPTYAAPTIVAPSVPATLVLTPVTGSGVSNVYVTIVVNPDGQYVATLSAKNLKPSTPYLIEGIPPSGGLPTPLFSTQDESIFTSRADGVGVYSHLMFFDPRIGFSQIFLMDFSTMQIVATVVLS